MASKHSKNIETPRKKKRKNAPIGEIEDKKIYKRKSKKKKNSKKIFFLVIMIILAILILYLGISAYKWKEILTDVMRNENSVILDSSENVIAEIGSERKEIKVENSEIPETLKNAYVSIEDERFYKHHGIDIKRTVAAIGSFVFHKGSSKFGGSTITQQLVKNITGDNSNSVNRKVKEWGKAIELEQLYSKDEILSTYLNIIYVGPSIYGVEAGAKYYFDKNVSELSIAECAFLAGLTNSPKTYNPFGDNVDIEKIKIRSNAVLNKMLEKKYINQEEYEKAKSEVEEGLKFKNGEIKTKSDGNYSYHTDAVISELISELKSKKGFTDEMAENYLNMAGLTIYSTQDTSIQESMEKEYAKDKYILKSKSQNGQTSQSAMVIMDHTSGQVVGCVGGLGEKKSSRELNRATMSYRQTGSSSKPISILVPAIAKRKITASKKYVDEPTKFTNIDGTDYEPVDYDSYQGEITVRRAVESSQNIPFVKMMEEIKPKTAIKYLKKMGITKLTDKDNNLALALGGEEKGVSTLEMAAAYSTIANDGVYIEPTFFTKVTNRSGKDIIKIKQKRRKVFSKEVAYIVKQLLKQPVEGANGTATYCSIKNMDVAAKTGTTNENYDRWLCGFTNYYTAATWYGFDLNETINFEGKNPAGLIWAEVMKNIHSNLKEVKFEMPSSVKTAKICKETGLVATDGCKDTYTEYYLFGTVPKKCTEHKSGSSITTKNNNNIVKNENNIVENKKEENVKVENKPNNTNETNTNTTTNTNTRTTNKNTTTENKTNTTKNQTKNNTVNNNSSNTNKTVNNSANNVETENIN